MVPSLKYSVSAYLELSRESGERDVRGHKCICLGASVLYVYMCICISERVLSVNDYVHSHRNMLVISHRYACSVLVYLLVVVAVMYSAGELRLHQTSYVCSCYVCSC